MGTSQSQPERRRRYHPFDVDGDDIPLTKGREIHRPLQTIKSTPGGGIKSSAYDLALISPSERTAVTDALSPTSMYSPTFTNISPIKKEKNFDFEVQVDEDDQFISDQGLDAFCSRLDMNSFCDPEFTEIGIETGIGIEKEESCTEEDVQVLTPDELVHSLTKEYDLEERNPVANDNIEERFATFPTQGLRGSPIRSMAQSNRNAIEDYGSYQMKASFDSPPLLAPPDDVAVALQRSSTYTAVDPTVFATFNKMKKDEGERKKQEKLRRREEKIKDRRRDLQGYRDLWGKYSEIQKKLIETRNETVESTSSNWEGSKISLADATTWFVDFNALAASNYLNPTEADDDSESVEDNGVDDHDVHEKNETELRFLLTSSAFYSRQDEFGLEELWRRNIAGTNESVSKAIEVSSSSSHLNNFESTTAFRRDDKRELNENDGSNNIPDDFDLGTRSIVSDLDTVSNASVTSDIDRTFDNNDYGVLRRYSRKSVESTIPADGQMMANEKSEESAQKEKRTTPSFSRYVVPSVSIVDAETGLIRWRQSPKKDRRRPETREMRIF